jgi:hypothetical protein
MASIVGVRRRIRKSFPLGTRFQKYGNAFSPLGIHGLEARATTTGQRGTGFQPVKPHGLPRCAVTVEYVVIFMKSFIQLRKLHGEAGFIVLRSRRHHRQAGKSGRR